MTIMEAKAPDIYRAIQFVQDHPLIQSRLGIRPEKKSDSRTVRNSQILSAVCAEWLATQDDSLGAS